MHMPKESRPVTRTGLQVLVPLLMTSDNWLAMCGKRLQMANHSTQVGELALKH